MQSNLTRRTFNAAVLAGFAGGLVGRPTAPASADALTLLDFAIAGGHYHGLAATMSDLISGDRLELRREADNPHDRNAIAVYRASVKLGYIPRAVNTPLAALMDAGRQIRADVVGFIDGREENQEHLAFTSFSSGDPKIRLFLEAQSMPSST
ncbi:HIRAN domain-containing protein [Rhizobium sp. RU36D]|uniref:HIRAN domain-containing protein n=1 Tax=Rhizobium sp. RU36D TaxID=1907415 RepID=UPI000A043D2E|nr:HIRAN domain-containing protein [Rhizobium sp. RU36D]